MIVWFFVSILCAAQVWAIELTCPQFRFSMRNWQCAPVGNTKLQDCYHPCTKKPIAPEKCLERSNSHCCLHNCRCIMRGGGNERQKIPQKYAIPSLKSASPKPLRLLANCVPEQPTRPTPQQPKSRPRPPVRAPRPNPPSRKPLVTKPKQSSPRPSRKPGQSRPGAVNGPGQGKNRKRGKTAKGKGTGTKPTVPATKRATTASSAATAKRVTTTTPATKTRRATTRKTTTTRRTRRTKKTTTTKKTRPTRRTTTCKPAKAGASVFGGLASLFSSLGFGPVEAVRTDC